MPQSCAQCGKETLNPKYCSRSCSAISNNAKDPKRQRTKKCRKCRVNFITSSRSYCDECIQKTLSERLALKIEDLTYSHLHKSSYYAKIRAQARSKYFKRYKKECSVCGYISAVEVSHIKPLSSFSENTLVEEVNDYSNLVGLCPNHHWELDHQMLDITGVVKPLLSEVGLEPT